MTWIRRCEANRSSHILLARFGVNTNSTAQRIEDLSGSQAGPSAEPERPRRRRRAPEAYGGQSHAITRAAEGDIGAWGRSWHEMVILEGIETQRRNVSHAWHTMPTCCGRYRKYSSLSS